MNDVTGKGVKDLLTKVLIKSKTMWSGDGGVKNCLNLRDFINGRPLSTSFGYDTSSF